MLGNKMRKNLKFDRFGSFRTLEWAYQKIFWKMDTWVNLLAFIVPEISTILLMAHSFLTPLSWVMGIWYFWL